MDYIMITHCFSIEWKDKIANLLLIYYVFNKLTRILHNYIWAFLQPLTIGFIKSKWTLKPLQAILL